MFKIFFVFIGGDAMVWTPAFETEIFRCAAVVELFQHGLAFRSQEIVRQEQSAVRMGRWWADEFDRLREHGRVIKMSA